MKNFTLKLALVSVIAFSANTHSFLIEPFMGLNVTGTGDFAGTDRDMDNMPVTVGGRLGYTFLGAMAGVEYAQTPGVEFETNTTTTLKYDHTHLGLFVGYELPILLRGWLTYVIDSELEGDTASIGNHVGGSGTVLGIGFTGLPFLSINFEYKQYSYDEVEASGTTFNSDLDFSMYALSVSLPLDI